MGYNKAVELHGDLPGEDLVAQGLKDLAALKETVPALLVSIGATRLSRAGLKLHSPIQDADQRLYLVLAETCGDDAHSQYNALIRKLVSFERALECVK